MSRLILVSAINFCYSNSQLELKNSPVTFLNVWLSFSTYENHRIRPCLSGWKATWAPSQYPKRRLSVRSRKVSKPRDLYLELSNRFEIWQALWQQCCRCACQISKRYDNLKYQSRGFETLRVLTERRLFGYWDEALLLLMSCLSSERGKSLNAFVGHALFGWNYSIFYYDRCQV